MVRSFRPGAGIFGNGRGKVEDEVFGNTSRERRNNRKMERDREKLKNLYVDL